MDYTHHIDFRSTSHIISLPHPAGQFRMTSAIMDKLHMENVRRMREGLPALAIAFPSLVSGGRNPMATVRIFGDRASLERFTASAATIDCGTGAGCSVRALGQVPETEAKAAFARDRTPEKGFGKHAERSLARAQRKIMARIGSGKEWTPPKSLAERAAASIDRHVDASGLAHIRVRSRSTQTNFSLYVRAVTDVVQASCVGPADSYGLSRMSGVLMLPHF